jgi:hypothetical protein
MIAKNVNTYAHGDIHLVVLAHLRMRWSLSGRDGFGVGFGDFREVKCIFYIDRTMILVRSRVRSVQRYSRSAQTRVCHRRVWSLAGLARPVRRLEGQQNVRG